MNKKRVAIIGIVGVPAKYGGFETLAENLIKELNEVFDFTVFCSSVFYSKKIKTHHNSSLIYLPFNANGKSSIIYDAVAIIRSLFFADVLLVLGVSAAFLIPLVKLLTNKKVITNIDGLEWKRDKWGGFAKKYLEKQEGIAVKYSDIIISDNTEIQKYVQERYNKESVMIPYGGDQANQQQLSKEVKEKYSVPNQYAFTVCRIEPENNIHIILNAFSKTNFNLVIIGNWKSSAYGVNLKNKFANFENIVLLDAIYDQNILDQIRSNCKLYVHGHSAGGTNPSLVEAMSLGLPIFAFGISYNKYSTDNKAVYFDTATELMMLIKSCDTSTLNNLGIEMKKVADVNYKWEIIAERYSKMIKSSESI